MSGKILALLLRSAWPRPSIDRLLRAAMLALLYGVSGAFSLVNGGRKLETPHLAVRYRAPKESQYARV